MKRSTSRKLRAELRQFFAEQPVMAIHEPALGELIGAVLNGYPLDLGRNELSAKLAMASSDPTSTQMIGQVAVLPVFGVLQQKSNWMSRYLGWTATETLERDFLEAAGNSQVKAVVLYCDTPGGNAMGNEETSRVIAQARASKPIVTFVRGLCCSAGYYLGSAASKIYASPSSLIGSIGAVSTHLEYSKAFAEMGIGATVVRSAPHKQLWNQFEKLSPEAKATLQKMVSDYGSQFEQAVARYRGVSQADVRAKYGQGDAFVAPEAKQRGLIDGVVSWETLLAKLQTGGPLPNISGDDGNDETVTRKQWSGFGVQGSGDSAGLAVQGLGGLADSFAPAIAASGSSLELSTLNEGLGANSHAEAQRRRGEEMKISAKVRAALFARGLIQAQDADESVCVAARDAFFAARGEACPQEDDKTCAALFAAAPAAAIAATAAPLVAAGGAGNPAGIPAPAPTNNVQAAHDREVAEAVRQQTEASALTRVKEIQASGKLLGMSQEAIDAAVHSGKPFADVAAEFIRELCKSEKPITPRADVKVGEEGASRYVADAVLATMIHFGKGSSLPKEKVTPQIEQLSRAPLYVHALQCLRSANVRIDDEYDREAVCEAAFAMDGAGRQTIHADGGIPYNRPGSFPNLLSALANKILDEGPQNAETSYEEYTGLWPGDLPDFKPAPVIAKGRVGELDEVLDAEAFKEQGLQEECLSYMQLSRFGNKEGLTPVLAANDDIGAFMEDLWGLSEGWELTQNRGCLRLITGNATLLDSYQLYDNTNHANHIASGGNPPSDSEWDAMQIKMANQTTIGAKARQRARLAVALVPTNVFRAAVQSFATMRDFTETKQPTTDSNLNIYRGKVTIVHEADLNDTSTTEWYGFASPQRFANATIVRAYFRGYGRKGKRERWYDPNTKTYWVSLEGRFGAAVKQYRTTVKNKGAA